MVHIMDWKAIHKDSAGISPKGPASAYLYSREILVTDAMVVVNGLEDIWLPLEMLDVKIIPLYL